MAIQKILETAKKFIQDLPDQVKPFHEVFFPSVDRSRSTEIAIDDKFGVGFAVAAIPDGGAANVRQYIPGQGQKFIPHIYRLATPIDEKMRDNVAVGLDAKSDPSMSYMRYVDDIINGSFGFRQAARMTRNKMAIDVMLEAKMQYKDEDANVLYQYDFGRSAANYKTPDFTAETDTPTFDSAVKEMYDRLKDVGSPTNNLALLVGSSWYNLFENSTEVQNKRNARQVSLIDQRMVPQSYRGTSEVVVLGMYHVDGMIAPITLLGLDPTWKYRSKSGASLEDYMPAAKAMLFNMNSVSWRFERGIDVLAPGEDDVVRAVGDLVIDSWVEKNPPSENIRCNFRPFYYWGNPDHIVVSTGTFS